MSVLMWFFNINPTLMTELMLGKRVDIGDGLEIEFGAVGERKKRWPGHSIHNYVGGPTDSLYFSFFLEGKHIGGLDHNCGGLIHERYDDGPDLDLEDDDEMRLQCLVSDRFGELFPNYDGWFEEPKEWKDHAKSHWIQQGIAHQKYIASLKK